MLNCFRLAAPMSDEDTLRAAARVMRERFGAVHVHTFIDDPQGLHITVRLHMLADIVERCAEHLPEER